MQPTSRIITNNLPKLSGSLPLVNNLRELPGSVPGFGDYNQEENVLLDIWKKCLKNCFTNNGFNPLEVSPFVRREFLQAKGGINNQIFSLNSLWSDEKTPYGLAFDRTVPLALWVRDHQKELTLPYKRYDIGLSYRGEKPSPGRFQGFYQCDVDTVGKDLSLSNDVQCISALVEGLTSLLEAGISSAEDRQFTMYLNHILIPKALFQQIGVSEDHMQTALSIVDDMEKTGQEVVIKELHELLKEKVSLAAIESIVKVFSYKGAIEDFPIPEKMPKGTAEGLEALKTIIGDLKSNGIEGSILQFCPGMVRGLNYYTGVVFETFLTSENFVSHFQKPISVMSGGRYDNLVDTFTKDHKGKIKKTGIEGVGGSIGLTRLLDVLLKIGLVKPYEKTSCKVIVLAKKAFKSKQWEISKQVRKEMIPCDVYTGTSDKITSQLEYANKMRIPIAIMVMEENIFCVKNLSVSKETEGDAKEVRDLTDQSLVIQKVKDYLRQ